MKTEKETVRRFMVALPYSIKKTVKDMATNADCTIAEIIVCLVSNASRNGKRGAK